MSDITIAASAPAFVQLFNAVRDNLTLSKSDSANFGPFSASYDVLLHLQNGTITLNDDNTIEVTNLEVAWDKLKVEVCFNLPGWCVGGFCVVPDPWNGCLVSFPGFCIGGPVCAPLDLSGLVSEISELKARLNPRYYIDPARAPGWSDLDAEFKGHPNKWRIFIDPLWVHVDPIDVPATVASLLDDAVRAAINSLIPSWVPGWARDLLWAIIGPVVDMVKGLLGIVGNIQDWLSNLLGNTFDLLGFIETTVADHFANLNPVYEFEDPYPVLPATGGLIPVKIPVRDLTATINSKEMVVRADVGA